MLRNLLLRNIDAFNHPILAGLVELLSVSVGALSRVKSTRHGLPNAIALEDLNLVARHRDNFHFPVPILAGPLPTLTNLLLNR